MTTKKKSIRKRSATSKPLVVERIINAPAGNIWHALTTNAAMKKWYFSLKQFKPRVGFKFQFTGGDDKNQFVHHCQITEVKPGKSLAYTWRYEGYEGESLVRFELIPVGERTRVRVTHTGLETFPKLPSFVRANFKKGWTYIVGTSLKKFVESQ